MSTVVNTHDSWAEYDAKQELLDLAMTSLRACSARVAEAVGHLAAGDAPSDHWRLRLDEERQLRDSLSVVVRDLLAETTAILANAGKILDNGRVSGLDQ